MIIENINVFVHKGRTQGRLKEMEVQNVGTTGSQQRFLKGWKRERQMQKARKSEKT